MQVNEKPFEDVKHCVSSLTKGRDEASLHLTSSFSRPSLPHTSSRHDLSKCAMFAMCRPGVVKFAQVVGVFPGPRFDDAEGGEGAEADVELLGWEASQAP